MQLNCGIGFSKQTMHQPQPQRVWIKLTVVENFGTNRLFAWWHFNNLVWPAANIKHMHCVPKANTHVQNICLHWSHFVFPTCGCPIAVSCANTHMTSWGSQLNPRHRSRWLYGSGSLNCNPPKIGAGFEGRSANHFFLDGGCFHKIFCLKTERNLDVFMISGFDFSKGLFVFWMQTTTL